jgi:hypothetical protein
LTIPFSEGKTIIRLPWIGNAGKGVLLIIVFGTLTGEGADLLHDGFEEPLCDLASRKPGQLGLALIIVSTSWPIGARIPALDTISDADWKTPYASSSRDTVTVVDLLMSSVGFRGGLWRGDVGEFQLVHGV